MLKPFFKVLSPEEALELFTAFVPLHRESVSMYDALYRVLAEPLIAEEDVPGFNRSTMDGIAVRAADTFGASESSPALFTLTGEIAMGELPEMKLKRGETVRIWTGGALPPNADAVVMIEHVEQIDRTTVEILKSVAPYKMWCAKERTSKRRMSYCLPDTVCGPRTSVCSQLWGAAKSLFIVSRK